MIDGDSEMPGITNRTQIGNEGDGFVRIRLISRYLTLDISCARKRKNNIGLIIYLITISK